ncbi:MAG: NfeD family protein [Verrucomicrobiales bacterium]
MSRLFILAYWLATSAACLAEKVAFIRVEGAIGPPSASYISRALDESSQSGAACLIIELDTPGGLLETTKTIVQKLLAAPVPVVIYVAPQGAGAGSAGVFITLAADVAAMAPATTIGAAHPVALGGNPTGGESKPDDTMKQKLENYAVSWVESIAAKRKRNVEWAKSSVKESASITAEKALELKVIDLIAADREDLLRQLDGREVQGRVLRVARAGIIEIPMLPHERVFQMLWRPEVFFLLMLIAIYGIIGELSNPGAIFPGVAGVIALILALYMGAMLPVNVAGIALIGLAVALFVIDVFASTHGVLTVGGIVAFFLGGLLLFKESGPVFQLSLVFLIPATVITGAFFLFIAAAGIRAQFQPVKVGPESMVGQRAAVVAEVGPVGGKVFLEGEYWNALSEVPLSAGSEAEVVAVEGLMLRVKPAAPVPGGTV